MVTPEVDRPAKMALVSMMVTLSFSGRALDLAADEAKACKALGSSIVTTCNENRNQDLVQSGQFHEDGLNVECSKSVFRSI